MTMFQTIVFRIVTYLSYLHLFFFSFKTRTAHLYEMGFAVLDPITNTLAETLSEICMVKLVRYYSLYYQGNELYMKELVERELFRTMGLLTFYSKIKSHRLLLVALRIIHGSQAVEHADYLIKLYEPWLLRSK